MHGHANVCKGEKKRNKSPDIAGGTQTFLLIGYCKSIVKNIYISNK